MKILVVEDDPKIASFVVKGLREGGHAADHAPNGSEGLNLAQDGAYDAAVVDIMLPQMDGLTLVEALRRERNQTPVIFLTAKREVDDRIKGLRAGGDDYLTKPFAFSELLARLQALVRRATRTEEPLRLSCGDLVVDLLKRDVTRQKKRLDLQAKEFALLELFLRQAERVVTKTMILEYVWDYHFDPQTNVVDVLVSRLRAKVDKGFPEPLIHTIRGVGYVLKRA